MMSVEKNCYEDYVDDDPFEFLTCSFSALTSPTVSCNHQYLMISITSKVFIDFFCVQIFDYNKSYLYCCQIIFQNTTETKRIFSMTLFISCVTSFILLSTKCSQTWKCSGFIHGFFFLPFAYVNFNLKFIWYLLVFKKYS